MADYNENDYFKILTDSIQVGSELPFDAFILLKKLGRIVPFGHQGSIMTEEDIQKLKSGQVTELYIKKDQLPEYQNYLKQFYATEEGQNYLSHKPNEFVAQIKDAAVVRDKLTRYEGQSVPTIIRELYDFSPEFKFFVTTEKIFENVSELTIQRSFIEIAELYKKLLVDNQLLDGDHRHERLMKLCQKQLDFIHRLQLQIITAEGNLELEKILHIQTKEEHQGQAQQQPDVIPLKREIGRLQEQIKTEKNLVEEAKLKTTLLNSFINESESYLSKLETENENQMNEIQEQRAKIEEAQEQLQRSQSSNDALLKDLARQKDEITHFKDNVNELRIKVTSKDQELKSLTQQFETKALNLGREFNKKQNEVVKLETELSEKNDTIKALYKDIEKHKSAQDNVTLLKKQIAEKVDLVKEMKIGYIKAQDDLRGKITALKNLNEKARKTIDYLTKVNDELRKKVA